MIRKKAEIKMLTSEKNVIQSSERLYWNVVKGIAVFLMIYGHCIQYCALGRFDFFENSIFKWIYSFHMPLFMIVSGYLFFYSFQKRTLSELLKHRTYSMLYPIVFVTITNNLLMMIPNTILSRKLGIFDGALFHGIAYSLWFLWSVLVSSWTVALICKVVRNWFAQMVLSAAGFLIVAMFPNMSMNLFMYPFFLVGFFFAMHKHVITKFLYKLIWAPFIVFLFMIRYYKTEHYIYITPIYSSENGLLYSLQVDMFRFLIGVAGSACVLAVVGLAFFAVGKAKKSLHFKPFEVIAKLGENSLQIYGLSVSLLSGYLPILYRKLTETPFHQIIQMNNWYLYNLVVTPLVAVAYCFGLYYLVCWLKKAKIHKYIFGR